MRTTAFLSRRCDDLENLVRSAIWRTIMTVLIGQRLHSETTWLRRVAWWALPHAGSWGMSPRAMDVSDRIKARTCVHNWQYDEEESRGPWTGYIERCVKCNALQQVPA